MLRLSRRKFYAIGSMVALLLAHLVFISMIQYNRVPFSTDETLWFVSAVNFVSFVLEVLIWWRLTGETFSAYTVFFFVLYIFTSGQCFGWVTGIEMGGKDLWFRFDHGLNHKLLIDGVCFSTA